MQPDLVLPVEVAAEVRAEMLERMRAGALKLCADLATLARRDPEAFERAWRAGVARLAAEALAHARVEAKRWAAPEAQWEREQ